MRLSIPFLLIAASAGAIASRLPDALAIAPRNDMANMDMSHDMTHDDESDSSKSHHKLKAVPHVMHHHHGVPILETDLQPEERAWWDKFNTTNYFNVESRARTNLWIHIASMLGSFIFLYPLCLVLNNIGHKGYLALLTVHTILVVVSLLNYSVFMGSIGDLYPGNAYNKMSWILLVTTLSQWVAAIVAYGYKASDIGREYYAIASDDDDDETHVGTPSSSSFDNLLRSLQSLEMEDFEHKTSSNSMMMGTPSRFARIMQLPVFKYLIVTFGKSSVYLFNALNWGHFFYFLVYFPTMVATFLVLGKGKTVFNLLAHFIKGGVFFSLGLLSLARYSGAFSNKGWAWNHKFISRGPMSRFVRLQLKGLWTMEFIESALILFYGCTNIFLEHLANPGGEWLAKDLQHASIAFIFIGCGFSGVLTEVKLSEWRFNKARDNYAIMHSDNDAIIKATPGFSPNPFPVLTIYWTGVLMSSHEQASALSTAIHVQWGNLFVLGCAFRFLTYVLFLISPPNKSLTAPSRPLTELVCSFALMCGGLVFMESTDPVIYLFEYYGFTNMFTLNVSLGVITLLMGWEMAVFAIKDHLVSKTR